MCNDYRLNVDVEWIRKDFGALQVDMERGFGLLRTEMIHRNAELLKWVLGFLVAQLGAIAGLMFFR